MPVLHSPVVFDMFHPQSFRDKDRLTHTYVFVCATHTWQLIPYWFLGKGKESGAKGRKEQLSAQVKRCQLRYVEFVVCQLKCFLRVRSFEWWWGGGSLAPCAAIERSLSWEKGCAAFGPTGKRAAAFMGVTLEHGLVVFPDVIERPL